MWGAGRLETVMQIKRSGSSFTISGDTYVLKFNEAKPQYVELTFSNGVGGELFVASGCDRDERIDTLVELGVPAVREKADEVTIAFTGKTTLWSKVDYRFVCTPKRLFYDYTVHGQGALDNARFFEGFLENDPRMENRFYPYYPGPHRAASYRRPWKFFATSSKPKFDYIHCFSVNATDTRQVRYYEDIKVRVCGSRVNLGGDWLVTPPPFLYQLGRGPGIDIEADEFGNAGNGWVNVGLVIPQGQLDVEEFQYFGGEGFGFNLTYDGYTKVDGSWTSPRMMFEKVDDVYAGLKSYCQYLRDAGCTKPNQYRDSMPRWWQEPIFGGWGEQVFRSDHWTRYMTSASSGWSGASDMECSQPRYEWMLQTLESKGVRPTILIVDNRWFREDCQLDVDTKLWPDMKKFIADQHAAGRKVILWVSPWEYCRERHGRDIPYVEHLITPRDTRYNLDIDTDVFYPACKREKKKTHVDLEYGKRFWPWQIYPNPYHRGYQKRIHDHVHHLLSPEGLDADGFEFDYTHYWEAHRGVTPVDPDGCEDGGKPHTGLALLHKLLGLYYYAAKDAKKDALVITHTFSPYFDDIVDMLRLQDIYTDRADISPQMHHRARIGNIVAPGAPIHTDQHPMPSLSAWRKYAEFQPTIGNPCLYYVSGIETTHEPFEESDFELLRGAWGEHQRKLEERFGKGKASGRAAKESK